MIEADHSADRDIALALSGGGYRAALFHLGVLRKIHELGLLDRLGVVSSVSGGSIVAGALARSLLLGEGFEAFYDRTLELLTKRKLDIPAILRGVLPWRTSSRSLERALLRFYTDNNGAPIQLSALDALEGPRFVFNATAIHNGHGWRFLSGGYVEEWAMGQTHDAAYMRSVDRYRYDATIARAVTASAAFPLFSALTLDRSELGNVPEVGNVDPAQFYQDLPDPVCLSDGGVRDNTGLTSILLGQEPPGFEDNYYLVSSDAGSIIERLQDVPRGRYRKLRYVLRQFEIRGQHNNMVTVTMALEHHRRNPRSQKGMAMLRMDEAVTELGESSEQVSNISRVTTRLKPPDWNTCESLMNHGANLLWARVSEYTDLLPGEKLMPRVRKRLHKELVDIEPQSGANSPYEEIRRFMDRVLGLLECDETSGIADAILSATSDERHPPLSVAAGAILRDLAGIGGIERIVAVRRLAEQGYTPRNINGLISLALVWNNDPDLIFAPFDRESTVESVRETLRSGLGTLLGSVLHINEIEAEPEGESVQVRIEYTILNSGERCTVVTRLES